MVLADFHAIQQQHRDIEAIAACQQRVGIHIHPFKVRQRDGLAEMGQFGRKLVAKGAIRPGQ
jgi:hypothetical protein